MALFDDDPGVAKFGARSPHHATTSRSRHRSRVLRAIARAHGYAQTASLDYLLTLLSRGVTAAGRAGEVGQVLVEDFERE